MIVFTGGTFSMKMDESTKAAVPFFHGEELIKMIPKAEELAKISVFEFVYSPG